MSIKARKVYDKLHDTLYTATHDSLKAYDLMLAWLLVDNCYPFLTQFKDDLWMLDIKNEYARRLYEAYTREDVGIIRNDWDDDLGELYMDLQSKSTVEIKGQFLTPINVAKMMAGMMFGDEKKKINVLDPCVGTGRLIMAGAQRNIKSYYYGVDIDQRATRTALVNCALHDIHGIILHADSLYHKTELGHPNWLHANQWDTHWDKLKAWNKPEKPSDNLKTVERICTYNITQNNNKLNIKLIDIKDSTAVAERREKIQQAVSTSQTGV